MHRLAQLALFAVTAATFTAGLLVSTPAEARHGIKCGWVLVSSVDGVNTWQYVCGVKGP